jgi:hypothetical protein
MGTYVLHEHTFPVKEGLAKIAEAALSAAWVAFLFYVDAVLGDT